MGLYWNPHCCHLTASAVLLALDLSGKSNSHVGGGHVVLWQCIDLTQDSSKTENVEICSTWLNFQFNFHPYQLKVMLSQGRHLVKKQLETGLEFLLTPITNCTQVVEMLFFITDKSPIKNYSHLEDQTVWPIEVKIISLFWVPLLYTIQHLATT